MKPAEVNSDSHGSWMKHTCPALVLQRHVSCWTSWLFRSTRCVEWVMDERYTGERQTAHYLVYRRVVGCRQAGNISSLSRHARARGSPPRLARRLTVKRTRQLNGWTVSSDRNALSQACRWLPRLRTIYLRYDDDRCLFVGHETPTSVNR